MKLSKDDHIDNIEMSVSSDSALRRAGLDTVGQFLDLTQLQVIRLPGMGRRNWREIFEIQNILAKDFYIPITHHFTFHSKDTSDHPNLKGRLADHWVSVELPLGHHRSHRDVFIEHFSFHYSYEYPDQDLKQENYPLGQLVLIKEMT